MTPEFPHRLGREQRHFGNLLGRRIDQHVRVAHERDTTLQDEEGLRINIEKAVRVLDPEEDTDVFGPLSHTYHFLVGRRGSPPDAAARHLATRPSIAAAMLLQSGQAWDSRDMRWQRQLVAIHPICAAGYSAFSGGHARLRALLSSSNLLPCRSKPLRKAAATMMAVPCWSS